MGSVNKIVLVGNLGRDAEMRFTQAGTPVAHFPLATSDRWTDRDGQKREETEWHRVNVWGKTAEAIHAFLTKGRQVYVEGKLQYRKWANKDGVEMTSAEIKADRVVLLGKGDGRKHPGYPDDPAGAQEPVVDEFDGDDIPF